jgi:SAM-dependent methyltransferase
MEWTGERFIPGEGGAAIFYEHVQRYHLARSFASGKQVIDFASGEGYGSNLLASCAGSVIGVELDRDALVHASSRYQRQNLDFVGADIRNVPLRSDSHDLVVCFEAIEHVTRQDDVLREARRLLRDDGLLIISTPERNAYSDSRNFENEFHVHEFYLDEFRQFLRHAFPHVEILGQRVVGASAIWPLDRRATNAFEITIPPGKGPRDGSADVVQPQFCIAICGADAAAFDEQLNTIVSVFMDAEQSFVAEHDEAVAAFADLKYRVLELETHDDLLLSIKARLEEERDQLKSRAETSAAENAAMRSSASWRITMPLRALARGARRLGRLSGLRTWRRHAS